MARRRSIRRLFFLVLSIGLLAGGLFNVVKVEDFARTPTLANSAGPPVKPIPDSDMVLVPGGSFLMGSPATEPGRERDERQHRVRVSAFYLDRFLVTQALWQTTTGSNPSYFKGEGRLPLEGVTWYDCIEFCNLLSRNDGRTPCYSYDNLGTDPQRWPQDWKGYAHNHIRCDWNANGYRLPTEAEWEYACRAGTTTATPYGASLSSLQADFDGEHPYNGARIGPNLKRTTPVGSFRPNAWGLYDMVGNVSQWCWDWYGDYPDAENQLDPKGPEAGPILRVHRGGSWYSFGSDLRAADRYSDVPFFRLDMLPGGLRLARGLIRPAESRAAQRAACRDARKTQRTAGSGKVS
jgi:formylglycine-generating enzyme required for sulfatase activity